VRSANRPVQRLSNMCVSAPRISPSSSSWAGRTGPCMCYLAMVIGMRAKFLVNCLFARRIDKSVVDVCGDRQKANDLVARMLWTRRRACIVAVWSSVCLTSEAGNNADILHIHPCKPCTGNLQRRSRGQDEFGVPSFSRSGVAPLVARAHHFAAGADAESLLLLPKHS
jgi:hypothetical protein